MLLHGQLTLKDLDGRLLQVWLVGKQGKLIRLLKLTGIGHKLYTMTHHTHLMQRWLTIEKHITTRSSERVDASFKLKMGYLLSIFEMSFHNPTILEERISTLVVSKVDTFASITNNISRAGICRGSISN